VDVADDDDDVLVRSFAVDSIEMGLDWELVE